MREKEPDGKIELSVALYLRDLGVERIIVEYSGGGDSGAIDSISYETMGGRIAIGTDDVDPDKHKQIETFAYNKLEAIEDWYNNDGGSGYMDINLTTGRYSIENNIVEKKYETFHHYGKINDDITDD